MFTDAEAVALTMGLLAIREFRFPVNLAAVEGALAKTERVMPEKAAAPGSGLAGTLSSSTSRRCRLASSISSSRLSAAAQERQQVFYALPFVRGERRSALTILVNCL